jgi:hypothetical protein
MLSSIPTSWFLVGAADPKKCESVNIKNVSAWGHCAQNDSCDSWDSSNDRLKQDRRNNKGLKRLDLVKDGVRDNTTPILHTCRCYYYEGIVSYLAHAAAGA